VATGPPPGGAKIGVCPVGEFCKGACVTGSGSVIGGAATPGGGVAGTITGAAAGATAETC
jgi:hypothetical protein